MICNELKSFIDTIEEFNDQALFDIGELHKNLPRSFKNWDGLFAYLLEVVPEDAPSRARLDNWPKGDSYRHWVGKLEGKNWSVSVSNPLLETQLATRTINQEAFKTKTLAKSYSSEYKKTLRLGANADRWEELLLGAVANMPPLPVIKYTKPKVKGKSTEAVLLLSDWHIGNESNIGNENDEDCYKNTYNIEIARKRVAKLVEDTINYCKKLNVKTLHVVNLGDMIQGIIHVNARIQQQLDVTQQVAYAGDLLSFALNKLQEAAPTITYRSCADNHSRVSPNKEESLLNESFGKFVDMLVEERFKGNKHVIFPKDNISYRLGKFKLANGKICMFAHGHENKRDNTLQSFTGANGGISPNYCFLAHYHNSSEKSYQGSKVFINGSTMATDDYADGRFLYGYAEQKLIIFDGDTSIDIDINIHNV